MRPALLLQTAFPYSAEKWRTATAFRCTLGVALPLLLALATGHAAWGVLASTGALNAGLASFNGVTRRRLRVMLGTSLTMSLVTVMALLVGGSTAATVLTVMLVGGLMSLYSGQGAAANTIGIQAITTLVVISGLSLPSALALPGGALVLAGGLLQTLLLTALWPAGRHHPERRAVRRVYRRLEDLIAALPASGDLLPEAAPFQEAWDVLDEARRFRWRPEHVRLRQALRLAEGLRAALVGYARADRQARERGLGSEADSLAAALLDALRDIQGQVMRGQATLTPASSAALQQALGQLIRDGSDSRTSGTSPDVLPSPPSHPFCHSLCPVDSQESTPFRMTGEAAHSLHYWAGLMVRLLTDLRGEPEAAAPPRPTRPPPGKALQSLWQSASPRTPAGRHALKYALALGLTTLAVQLWQVPHGYWLTLTVGVVLKPDYVTTLTRGVARLGGTLLGVAVSALLVWAFHPGAGALLFGLAAAWLSYAVFLASYAAFSAAITVYVVMLLVASGVAEGAVAGERLLFTLLGGVIALAVYPLWPDWQSRQLRAGLEQAARAQVTYLQAVAELWQGGDPEAVSQARARARALRVKAEGLVRAAHLEPARVADLPLTQAEGALMRLNASAALSLSLHAEALQRSRVPAQHSGRQERARRELDRALQEAGQLCAELALPPSGRPPPAPGA
ncbi:hypothetical protein DEIPH_ctg020orf0008 [Deinococcus phoenicis]|uniref:Integral membrane bound transporter domain-containing protein n=1 Tax=Deinococcus phoenicis TaxID=1476583 RepID=A0A016QS47_9DEIO|nr:FUSC family protein [Deinococcus phoenicis]EYB68574.1 hypothetical protein DEIPH_ctg020orf0008 [Deinococcus phoenicis]